MFILWVPIWVIFLQRKGLGLTQIGLLESVGTERAPLQQISQFSVLLRCPYGEHFHAPVPKISYEAADLQLFRGALCEEAEAHTLDHAGYEIAFG